MTPFPASRADQQRPPACAQGARVPWRLLAAQFLAGWLPPFTANRLRPHALRAAGFQIGRGTIMWGMPTIIGAGAAAAQLTIGAHCGFNVGCVFELEAPVTIGDHVSFGHDVLVLTGGHEPGGAGRRAGAARPAPVVIEDGAWIAARAVIMPGVTIGAGAVIGATVVVSQDVPPHTLLAGPQRISLARWR